MASVKQFQVTFDCAEPERVARFWCEVLGYVAPPPPEGFAAWDDFTRTLPPEERGSWFACTDPAGVGPRLYFQRVPEGKTATMRLCLPSVSLMIGSATIATAGGSRMRFMSFRPACWGATTVRHPDSARRCWTAWT